MSFLLNAGNAKVAFDNFVLPGIQTAMQSGVVNKQHLYVVALNPLRPWAPGIPDQQLPILFEYSIGQNDWSDAYDEFARAKARITWRTGLSSREVASTKPQLLASDDFPHSGSAIVGGIISAASGVQGHFDELFASMTSAALSAMATEHLSIFKDSGSTSPFLP